MDVVSLTSGMSPVSEFALITQVALTGSSDLFPSSGNDWWNDPDVKVRADGLNEEKPRPQDSGKRPNDIPRS
jgi:hypothetical protein